MVHLHSHDELGGLAREAEAEAADSTAPLAASPDPASPLHWTYSFGHDDVAAPLLPSSLSKAPAGGPPPTPLSKALVFGAINAVAGIPALVAYAAIVFKHPTYAPYLDLLCKFFFISSALHQAVFCLMSALPFAMGQVQDVGEATSCILFCFHFCVCVCVFHPPRVSCAHAVHSLCSYTCEVGVPCVWIPRGTPLIASPPPPPPPAMLPGIIFLSAMGSSIATLCLDAGKDAEVALGTALLTMTASTFLVGLGTLLVGEDGGRDVALGGRLLCWGEHS
jgi:hypothetical protein